MSILFDIELFFVGLANSIIEFPKLRRSFDEYYKADKYRFYERAKRSDQYNHKHMSWRSLESEVAIRRGFGILLCTEEDESCRDFVCRKLLSTDKRFPELVKNPDRSAVDAFIRGEIGQMQNTSGSDEAKSAPMYFLAYLFYAKYGTNSENKTINDYLSHTHKVNQGLFKRRAYFNETRHPSSKKSGITIPKKSQAIIKQLKTSSDLFDFLAFHGDDVKTVGSQTAENMLSRHIKNYYNLGYDEANDTIKTIMIVHIAAQISATFGIDLHGLRGPEGVTNDERNMIVKMLADMNPGATASELSQLINVTNYATAFIFMLLVKEIRNIKAFYFRNNSETQYLELQRLEDASETKDLEIERLRAELDRVNTLAEQQKEEVRQLAGALAKANKDAIKPYASEISELNGKVREFEKALEAEEAKALELNALREFVFAAQSEYVPPETAITLNELVQGKRLIIIGGHANWRNRMQERYPTITFLDGHNASFDSAMFDKADLTLFRTSNMSHKAYFKAIEYLRDRKLKFDYLGRSNNPDLIEAEIVSVMKEKCDIGS